MIEPLRAWWKRRIEDANENEHRLDLEVKLKQIPSEQAEPLREAFRKIRAIAQEALDDEAD
jgi:hypothetical protein